MASSIASLSSAVAGTCNQVLATARALDRHDLVTLITAESSRWNQSDTTIVVAGEPDTGKSVLVAALCGRAELVSDGPTVAYSVIARPAPGDDEHIVVHRGDDAEPERRPLADLAGFVSATHNPGNRLGISAVHVAIRSELLDAGVVLVDTPGVDGLDGRWGALTLCSTEQADHLLLATGADAPLTLPELRFLERAASRLDTVSIVLTRVDRFRGATAIATDDAAAIAAIIPHLAGSAIIPVASNLAVDAIAAEADGDGDLADVLREESHIEALRDVVRNGVAARVRFVRLANLGRVASSVVEELITHLALGDQVTETSRLEERKATLQQTAATLRESSPSWSTALADDFTLLRDSLHAELQGASARLVDRLDEVLDSGVTADDLDERLEVEFRIANLELSAWLRQELDGVATRHGDRCSGDLTAPSTPDLDPDVNRPATNPRSADGTIRLRIATAMSTTLGGLGMMAVTSVGAAGAGGQAGLFRLGTLAVSVLVGSATAAAGVRHSKKQERVTAGRSILRAELDAWRVAASNQARAAVLGAQRTLEAETKALLRDRQAAVAAELDEVKHLMSAGATARAAAAQDADTTLAALRGYAADLSNHATAIAEALTGPRR